MIASSMISSSRIGWCGSCEDGLGWLRDRCGSIDEEKISERISIDRIDAICAQHPRRLILSVENRLNYPLAEIEHLQQSWPEVPWALALGTWFDGSRRTGMGATSHLSLPWYRWWDGWRPWLVGSNPELLNPWPRTVLNRSLACDGSVKFTRTPGVILSNCRQTAEAWQAGLECDSACTQLLTLSEFHSLVAEASPAAPHWILWDDSCLDTFRGADSLSENCALFAKLRERFPKAVIFAATCMPRWFDWQQWMSAGVDELLAKPSQGFPLREVLQHYAR